MGLFQKREVLPEIEEMAYWNRLSPGDVVILSDIQTIEKSAYAGDGANSINYVVKTVERYIQGNDDCVWIAAKLRRTGSDDLLLVIKKVDGVDPEARIYYTPMNGDDPVVPSGNRRELIQYGHDWMFEEEINDELPLCDNSFCREFPYFPDGETEVLFPIKPFGELRASVLKQVGNSRYEDTEFIAKIVEYKADESMTNNPEALIVEIGDDGIEDGGEINFYLGTKVHLEDVCILDAEK